ncbi:MAG: ABC transporter permease [Acidobacteriia bacterium]|nr:ABC transporter permease [Terriglobia bacterium]
MPGEAPRQASAASGGAEQAKQDLRGHGGLPWFEALLQDLRFGLRTLRKNPGFTTVAILTLALGIGATTAIFTVVDKVLLQPLAYREADRMVVLMQTFSGGQSPVISIPKYMLWHDQPRVFEESTLYGFPGTLRVNLLGGDQPEQFQATQVSADFFSLFGVRLVAGRAFTAEEDAAGGLPVVVISSGLWRSRFGANPHIVGRTVDVDGTAYNVIGVMAPLYTPDLPLGDMCFPLQADPNSSNQGNDLFGVARLKPGVTLAMAKAATQVVAEEFRRKYPAMMDPKGGLTVETMHEVRVANIRTSLLVLLGAVSFVLLIACANVASLMLARATLRKREISIRAALGAGRGRIVRQLLTESVLLSLVGGALGLYLGYFGVRFLLGINPANLPRIGEHAEAISLDWRVLVFTLAVAVLTGMLAGLIPAIKASRTDLATTINESGTRSGTGLRGNKTRSVLVVTELAMAMVLLVGAALLMRTFHDSLNVKPGFQTHNILTMGMALRGARFQKTAPVAEVVREGRQRLESLPGVEAAAAACCLPLEGGYGLPFNIEGRPPTNGPFTGGGSWRSVSPEYFEVLRISLLRGRTFTDRDDGAAEPVVVINEAMAKQFWPKGDELGARITIAKGVGPQFEDPPREIIGVVGDVRDNGLNYNPQPTMYVPLAQVNDRLTALDATLIPMQWLVRTRVEPHSLTNEIERELRTASGGLPVGTVQSMDQVLAHSIAGEQFNMTLLTSFAAIALFLAAIGIYGIMAYSVQQRTQEIGIRMTLGASPQDVRWMVVLQGMILALIGVSLGVAGGLALTRLMRSLLYGVKPWDPLAFVLTAVLLSAVALFACYVPARRASRVNPMVALRYE